MKFRSYALNDKLLEALKSLGYDDCTPVQDLVIPQVLKNKNLFVQSETGSGKTHAFLVPILNKIDTSKDFLQALIISPTRELAAQTYEFANAFKKYFKNLKVKLLVGGAQRSDDESLLNNAPHILIGTPGRLNDVMIKNSYLKVSELRTVVIDEADMCLEMGFFNDVHQLILASKNHQILVFSATYSKQLENDLRKYIEADAIIKVGEGETSNNVRHYAIDKKHFDKNEVVVKFIQNYKPYFLLIFCSLKNDVNTLYKYLLANGLKAGIIHGDLESRERKSMMKRIKNQEFNVVVCSDMAARGMDIKDVSTVLNYDLPNNIEFYFHRAGRTGRYHNIGECYTLYNVDEIQGINKLKELGVKFSWIALKGGEFVNVDEMSKKKKKVISKEKQELNEKIRIETNKVRSKKVKPNYKKKIKEVAEKVKRQHKREIIRKDIRRQRVERYKSEGKK